MKDLAERFRHFAEFECHDSSPLYEHLAKGVAEDIELLKIAAHSGEGQPPANLLFAAVHFLLLRSDPAQSPLRAFYPDLSDDPADARSAFPSFKAFCLDHRGEIESLLRTHLVQTNEVRRCGVLLPALAQVWREGGKEPLALVEIGASAGLNLLGERYGFLYSHHGTITQRSGLAEAVVNISCELRGSFHPSIPNRFPPVTWRVGIDLNPIDVGDCNAVAWLKALIWPEHKERAVLLAAAVAAAQNDTPPLLCGDAITLLPEVLANAPTNTSLCVFHSHTVNQFSQESRERLRTLLREASRTRPIWRVSLEGAPGEPSPFVTLLRYTNGIEGPPIRLARYDSHGRWLEWLLPPSYS